MPTWNARTWLTRPVAAGGVNDDDLRYPEPRGDVDTLASYTSSKHVLT